MRRRMKRKMRRRRSDVRALLVENDAKSASKEEDTAKSAAKRLCRRMGDVEGKNI